MATPGQNNAEMTPIEDVGHMNLEESIEIIMNDFAGDDMVNIRLPVDLFKDNLSNVEYRPGTLEPVVRWSH